MQVNILVVIVVAVMAAAQNELPCLVNQSPNTTADCQYQVNTTILDKLIEDKVNSTFADEPGMLDTSPFVVSAYIGNLLFRIFRDLCSRDRLLAISLVNYLRNFSSTQFAHLHLHLCLTPYSLL